MCKNCECNDDCLSPARDFGWALNCLKHGKAVARKDWEVVEEK